MLCPTRRAHFLRTPAPVFSAALKVHAYIIERSKGLNLNAFSLLLLLLSGPLNAPLVHRRPLWSRVHFPEEASVSCVFTVEAGRGSGHNGVLQEVAVQVGNLTDATRESLHYVHRARSDGGHRRKRRPV